MANSCRLHWSKTTPFTAKGNLGDWSLRWFGSEKAYVVLLNGERRFTAHTAITAKLQVEHLDCGEKVCRECNGSGWTK